MPTLHNFRRAADGRSALLRRARVAGVLCATALAAAACYDLQVTNPNTLDLDAVFSNASNTEASLIGAWRRYTASTEGRGTGNQSTNCPVLPMSLWGNELTSTSTNLDMAAEPRAPIDNRDVLSCATRGTWYDTYASIAGARESYQAVLRYKHQYGTVDATTPDGKDTPRLLIFSKFIVALGTVRLGLVFDQAFITDVTTDAKATQTLAPYPEVLAAGVAQLRAVIADARAAPDFVTPTTWINTRLITRDELIRICLSYITRAEVYGARTPTERAAVNWARVLARLDSGITRDFSEQADPTITATASPYYNLSFAQNTVRISNRFLGPSDTSGKYQAWLAQPLSARTAVIFTTPDRRVHGGAGNTVTGTLFIKQAASMGSASNGPYLTSWYRSIRYLNTAADSGNRALINYMSVPEMNFIRAEANYRLGNLATAAGLINATRVAAGLKAAVTTGPPAGADCVPRKDSGACGDLFDAIQYEKRIVLFPLQAEISWFDQRGWGKLIPGTILHMPVSGRELTALGLTYYTFGGTGNPGSAP